MVKHVRLLIASLVVLASLFSISAAPGPQGAPDGWLAHPPIHVRGNATTSPTGYSPAQVRHGYGFDQLTKDGTGQIIAIVDAYDAPTVAGDLQNFITQFPGVPGMYGLPGTASCTIASGPTPCFQKVYAQGKQPRANSGWALEASLDTQWAHSIAPQASILFVESADASFNNLLQAVDFAANSGATAISMSWGGSEFSSESSYDSHFNRSGVVFIASSGDSGTGAIYPSISPYVVSVGGTTLPLDSSGNLKASETAWSGSGGGMSAYEAEPGYQSSYPIPNTGGKRGNPDVSYDADPNTGFSVYDSTSYQGQSGWFQVGGTSAGAPQWAGLVALANQGRSGTLSSNSLTSSSFYSAPTGSAYASNYRDISSGKNGTCGSTCTASTGYDFVTGLGSPLAAQLVPYLNSPPTATPDFSLSASPSSQTVTQGNGTSYAVTITDSGGFTGSVSLTVSGLPTGSTSSFSPNPATTSSTLSVGSSASTPTGTYPLAVTGTSGTLTHTTSATLVVNTASTPTPTPAPDFSLSASPSSQTVTQGGSTSYTVTITDSGGFTGSVSLSISGLPTGSTSSFSPNPAITSSTLSVGASASTPTGTYPLTVTGASGSLTHTTSTTLVVNAPSTPALSVSVSTDKGSYRKGSTVNITVKVTSSGAPFPGATAYVVITDPSGVDVGGGSGTTDSNGQAHFSYLIPTTALSGVYTVQAAAGATAYSSGYGSDTFRVRN